MRAVLVGMLTSMSMAVTGAARAQLAATPTPAPEPAATTWDVEALVAEALAHNPEVLAARAAYEAARHRPGQVAALPDPQLALGYTNDGWRPSLGGREMTTLALMASQTLPAPGRRGLRAALTAADAEQVGEALARTERRLRADVQRGVVAAQEAQALLVLAQAQTELWREAEGAARARYAVGQGAQQDVLRVQVELTRARQQELEQGLALDLTRTEMARLLGREQPLAGQPPPLPNPVPWSEAQPELEARLEAASPELNAGRHGLRAEQTRVALARQAARPDVTVQAGYMHRGGLDPMWQAGLSVDLPVRGRARALARAEAEARLQAARAQNEAQRQRLRARTQARLLALRNLEQVAELYARGIIPQGRLGVEAAVAGFQAGKVPFTTVLEALGTSYADRAQLVRLHAAHARGRVALEEASLEPSSEPLPMPAGQSARAMGGLGAGATPGASTAMGAPPAGEAASTPGMRMP